MFDPKTASFREYNVTTPNSLLEEISIDGFGNPWFTELNGEHLGELNVSSGMILEFSIPNGPGNLPCGPIGVTPYKTSIWITCEFSDQIDQFFSENSTFASYDLPIFYSAPLDIVFDSTGNFWFSAADSNMIGYVTTSTLRAGTTDGIQEFAPRNVSYLMTVTNPQAPPGLGQSKNGNQTIVSSLATPSQLALSPDGKEIWITEHVSSSFDEYDINSKVLDKYWTSRTHNPNYANSLPNGIAVGSNGIVWIAEHYGNKIAEFDPTTRTMTEYPIPCCGSQLAGTLYLALGQNSSVWFTELYGNNIGELVPAESNGSFYISPENTTIALTGKGGNASIPIHVSSDLSNQPQSVSFDISGVTESGLISNASVYYSPPEIALTSNGSGTSELNFRTENLSPGNYYLTASGRSSLTGDIYSTIISLVITDLPNYPSLLTDGVILGVVLAFATVGSLVVILRRRPRRSRLPRK